MLTSHLLGKNQKLVMMDPSLASCTFQEEHLHCRTGEEGDKKKESQITTNLEK